jgi:hypothetical protein
MLYVSALGGLGNRLRVVDSAVAFAEARNGPVTVLWNLDQTLGTPAGEIFAQKPLVARGVTIRSERRYAPRRVARALAFRFRQLPTLNQEKIQALRLGPGAGETEFLALDDAHLRTGHRFFDNPEPYAWLLWATSITDHLPRMPRPTLGLHLRGTDRRSDHTEPTVKALLALARSHLDRESYASVFIASDEASLAEKAKRELGEKATLLQSLTRDRSHDEAGIHAARDLVALSRCESLFTNTTSSYARLAAQLGAIPLTNLAQLAGFEAARPPFSLLT